MKTKISLILFFGILGFVSTPLIEDCDAKENIKVIRFGSSSVGSSGYTLMAGMTNLINKYTNYEASVIPSGGSGATIRSIARKERDFGFGNSYEMYAAYTGTASFAKEGKQPIRLAANGYTTLMTFVAQPKINTVNDFKGKVFMYKRKQNALWGLYGDSVINAYGLAQDEVRSKASLETKEVLDGLKVGSVHIGLIPGGIPNGFTIRLLRTKPFNLINIDMAKLKVIEKKYPFMIPMTIPAGTYKGVDKDVNTMGYTMNLFVHADLPDKVVYESLKAVFGHHDEFVKVHSRAKKITLQNASKNKTIPFHPGAIKYYKEVGVY